MVLHRGSRSCAGKRTQADYWEWKRTADVLDFIELSFSKGFKFFPVRWRPVQGRFFEIHPRIRLEHLHAITKGFEYYETLRDGSWIFSCNSEEGARALLNTETFMNTPIFREVEWLRLGRRYVLRGPEPDDYMPGDLAAELMNQGLPVVQVKKLSKKRLNEKVPVSTTFIDFFNRDRVIEHITLFNKQYPVQPYEERFKQCLRCYRFGHMTQFCKGPRRCVKCREYLEDNEEAHECTRTECVNCYMWHEATNENCSARKKEFEIIEIMNEYGITRKEAEEMQWDRENERIEKRRNETLRQLGMLPPGIEEASVNLPSASSSHPLGIDAEAQVSTLEEQSETSSDTASIPGSDKDDDDIMEDFDFLPTEELIQRDGYWCWKAQKNLPGLVRLAFEKGFKHVPVHMRPQDGSFPNIYPWTRYNLLQDITPDFEYYETFRDGSFLFFCTSEEGVTAFLNCTSFLDVEVTCEISWHLVGRRFVLHSLDIQFTASEIGRFLTREGHPAVRVKRLPKKGDNKTPLPTIFIDFVGRELVEEVKLFGTTYFLNPYEEKVKQCTKCQRFGHLNQFCRGERICVKCAEIIPGDGDHECLELQCANCREGHLATDEDCPARAKEQRIVAIMSESGVSRREAVRIYEQNEREAVLRPIEDQEAQVPEQPEEPLADNNAPEDHFGVLNAELEAAINDAIMQVQEPLLNEIQNIMAQLLTRFLQRSHSYLVCQGG